MLSRLYGVPDTTDVVVGRAEARVAFMPLIGVPTSIVQWGEVSGIRCDRVAERENFGGRLKSIIVRKLRIDFNQAASELRRITYPIRRFAVITKYARVCIRAFFCYRRFEAS